jgi:tetratricopeptide (TPR) repeat protein
MATEKPFKLLERWPKRRRVPIDPETVTRINDLCHGAHFYDAWQLAEPLGPPQSWAGFEARLAGAILANNLGGRRLGDLLDLSCFRDQPLNADAQYGFLTTLQARRGPLAAWRAMSRLDLEGHSPKEKARFLSLKAWIAQRYRDFDAAEEWLRLAHDAWPNAGWNLLLRSGLLMAQDRFEEALDAAMESLAARPWYRPAVSRAAECLKSLNRESEAIALITAAFEHVQDPDLASTLVGIHREQENFSAMLEPLEIFAKWSPLMEPASREWLLSTKAEAFYHLGDFEQAAACAENAGSEFPLKFAERLRSAGHPRKRVRLPVGFVRQRHNTCAPATLSALVSFWGMPVPEREIAEEICYDGTYDLHERRWAEETGYFVREFRVTSESARALIDRGIPFAMVTSTPTSSHLQAVIGYDEMRDTLLIREPSDREYCEFVTGPFFTEYAAIGPRGMAIVPAAKRSLLADIELPENGLYDSLYGLNGALEAHDRAKALDLCQQMEAAAPGHRLSLVARRMLADYDRNVPSQLAAIEGLLAQFPGDERLELARIYCLRTLARRDVRLESLERLSGRKEAHPVFWKEYAVELADDARQHDKALRYLWRAHRATPGLSSVIAQIADIYWDQQRIEESMDLYRFASCMDDKNEGRARSFFIASRHMRKTAEALEFLRRRFAAYGGKSGDPARTLFNCLDDLERTQEALEVLEEAIRLRPEDGMLMLFAADQFALNNRLERAAELLNAAKEVSQETAWLRTSARLALNRGEPATALEFWSRVIELEPLEEDAQGAFSRLLEQTEGRARALQHLRETCERFPHNVELNKLWLAWLREKNDADAEMVARRLVEIDPTHAWARRELAMVLQGMGRLDEALAEAEIGRGLNPGSSYGHSTVGAIQRKRGAFSLAREALREAIRIDVDNSFAIENLVAVSPDAESRRQDLAFVRSELIRQVVFGSGLLAYRQRAQGFLNPGELLADLQGALEARPDLWHAWSAVTNQLLSCGQVEEALAQAEEMTRRFPLTGGSWRILGSVHDLRHDWRGAVAAYEHAVLIEPGWSAVVCELSEAYERAGDREAGRRVLEHALVRKPLDDRLHGYLAQLLWNLREKEAALDHLRQAVKLNPEYEWAWDCLRDWDTADKTLEMARELTLLRGGEARSWLMLAYSLTEAGQREEQMEALEKALTLDPQLADAYDRKAEILCKQERFDEALAACKSPVWQGNPPASLRGRAAWIEARRGNRKEGIRLMRAVVADDDGYVWGWQRLADWLEEEQEYLEALVAAEKMVHWNPRVGVPYGYRAAAKLNIGDRYGALDDLEKALKLDPAYQYAEWTLFDLQLDDDEHDAAATTLDGLREHSEAERIQAAEAKLAQRRESIVRDREAYGI